MAQRTPDSGRNAAGVVEINNGTAGTFRDLKLRNLISGAATYTFPTAYGAAGTFLKDLLGNGVLSWATPAEVDRAPGGSPTQVQFNDGGVFGGDPGLVYDKTRRLSRTRRNAACVGRWANRNRHWARRTSASRRRYHRDRHQPVLRRHMEVSHQCCWCSCFREYRRQHTLRCDVCSRWRCRSRRRARLEIRCR